MTIDPKTDFRKHINLSDYCSYKIGGPAQIFFEPETQSEVVEALGWVRKEKVPFFLMGDGTNLLFSDEGFPGLIIKLGKKFSSLKINETTFEVEAGHSLLDFISEVNARGFSGMEKMAGIPGTLGGALHMNAGAFVQEIKDYLSEVTVVKPSGDLAIRTLKEMQMGYRSSYLQGSGDTALRARFQFRNDEKQQPEDLKRMSEETIRRRSSKQPLEFGSCGSVFKSVFYFTVG